MNKLISKKIKIISIFLTGWIRHRPVVFIMLFAALFAVLFPLSLLWKIKESTVAQIHHTVSRQPALREIYPSNVIESEEWFEKIGDWKEVEYIIPSVLIGSLTVEVNGKYLDLVPSSNGDPILNDMGEFLETNDQIILTESAANMLKKIPGDTIDLEIYRDNGFDVETVNFTVVGILDSDLDELERAYVNLDFLEQIESFRSGRSVFSRQWSARPGHDIYADYYFDNILLLGTREPDKKLQDRYSVTNLSKKQAIDQLNVVTVPDGIYSSLAWGPEKGIDDFTELLEIVSKSDLIILPQVDNSVILDDLQPKLWDLEQSINALKTSSMAFSNKVVDKQRRFSTINYPIKISMISNKAPIVNPQTSSSIECVDGFLPIAPEVAIPCSSVDYYPSYWSEIEILSRSKAALLSGMIYKPGLGWQPNNREYAGFRIFAKAIEDVKQLRERLENEGIQSTSNQSVATAYIGLDESLNKAMQLLSVLVIAGAICVVSMNFSSLSALQNESYAILRLYGVDKIDILMIPITLLVISVLTVGFIAELLAYVLVKPLTNLFAEFEFVSELVSNGSFWYLDTLKFTFVVLSITLIVCIFVVAYTTRQLLSNSVSTLMNK